MTIGFRYEEASNGYFLKVKTNQQVEIKFFFKQGEDNPKEFFINEYDFYTHAEFMIGVYVSIGDEIICLRDLMLQAVIDLPDILDEVAKDGDDYASHEEYVASFRNLERA